MKSALIIAIVLLSGCVQNHHIHEKEVAPKTLADCGLEECKPPVAHSFKQIELNQYVRALTQDLISTLDYANKRSVFGVTNFTYSDSDLKTLPIYSHQISEALQHELHMFGLPVLDFKSTGSVQVTPTGDFARSRDYKELKSQVRMDYLISGTLTKLTDGVLVNAKVVGAETLAIVASSQIYIPKPVLDRVISSEQGIIRIN